MEFVRNDGATKSSSGVGASMVEAVIITAVAFIFAMFGDNHINIWPTFSNWMAEAFLSDSTTAYYKFGGLWLVFFLLIMAVRALSRHGGSPS